jgi:hypothetical protein
MKMIWKVGLSVIAAFLVSACFNPPEYPSIPEITFNKIKFIDTPDPAGTLVADTLALSIDFKDGDGDLGLTDSDLGLGQFAERYYFKVNDSKLYYNPSGDPLQLVGDPNIIRYKTKRTVAHYDTLPAYVKPFNCTNWEVVYQTTNNITKPIDTLYFKLNPNHYNVFVDFLVKDPFTGTFVEYDFRKEFCTTYDGRLPVLSKDIGQETPLEGTIRYAMAGTGFNLIFSGQNKNLKLRIRMQDRALHQSNELLTPEFTLADIK